MWTVWTTLINVTNVTIVITYPCSDPPLQHPVCVHVSRESPPLTLRPALTIRTGISLSQLETICMRYCCHKTVNGISRDTLTNVRASEGFDDILWHFPLTQSLHHPDQWQQTGTSSKHLESSGYSYVSNVLCNPRFWCHEPCIRFHALHCKTLGYHGCVALPRVEFAGSRMWRVATENSKTNYIYHLHKFILHPFCPRPTKPLLNSSLDLLICVWRTNWVRSMFTSFSLGGYAGMRNPIAKLHFLEISSIYLPHQKPAHFLRNCACCIPNED